jgi:DinB superfamily
MPPQTPYSKYLGDREPVAALLETSTRISELVSGWKPAEFERSYEPGKWNARQILLHMAHIEMAFGLRVRMALSTPSYAVQPFDQDRWMEHESNVDGRAAADAFLALSRLNSSLFATLSAADMATPVSHPEAGSISVAWIVYTLAGHQVSHLPNLESIARQNS